MAKKEKPWHDGISHKERLFIEQYLTDLNATKAAMRAGYSKRSAGNQGCVLLKRHRATIDALFETRGCSRLRVLEEMSKVAFATIGDYVRLEEVKDKDGKLTGKVQIFITPTAKLTADQIAALGEITETITEFGTAIKIKPWDKITALAWLGKANRLFVDRHEITGKDGGAIVIDDAKARLEKLIEGMAGKIDDEEKPKEPKEPTDGKTE